MTSRFGPSAMLLGVLSDTHGMIERTREAVRRMQDLGVVQVIHCGDIGSPEIVPLFEPFAAHFVLGNCDNGITVPLAVEAARQTCHGQLGQLELEGRKVAFLHGDSPMAIEQLLHEAKWDLICHGHTHQASVRSVGNTLVVNPGALARCAQPSLAVIRLAELKVTLIALDSAPPIRRSKGLAGR